MSDPLKLEPGSSVGEHFRVESTLSSTHGSTLYAAHDRSRQRDVHVWVLHPAHAPDDAARTALVASLRAGAAAMGDAAPALLEAGVDPASGSVFVATEPVRGESLLHALERQGTLHPADLIGVFRQLAAALEPVHARGAAHGALSAEFVFLAVPTATPDAPAGSFVVRLALAGLAPSLAPARSLTVSPEQSRGEPATPRSDVWSLALLAYRLLTGTHYWDADGSALWRRNPPDVDPARAPLDRATDRARPHGAAVYLPADFDAWFARCTSRDVSERYADARAALDALIERLEAAVAPAYRRTPKPKRPSATDSDGVTASEFASVPTAHDGTEPEHARAAALPPPPVRPNVVPERPDVETRRISRPSRTDGGVDGQRISQTHSPSDAGHRRSSVDLERRTDPRNVGQRRSEAFIAAEPPVTRASQTAISRPGPPPPSRSAGWWLAIAALCAGAAIGVPIGRATMRGANAAGAGARDPNCADRPPDYDPPPADPFSNAHDPSRDASGSSPGDAAAGAAVDGAGAPAAIAVPSASSGVDASAAPVAAGTPRELSVNASGGGRIFDNHTTTATFNVSESCTIARVQLTARGTHSFFSDLVVRLRSPGGQTQVLQTHADRSPFRRYDVVRFDGSEARGTWTFAILDDVGGDSGALSGATLNLRCR